MPDDRTTPDDGITMEDLLETFEREKRPSLEVGDRITATIVSIGKEHVFMDTGTKLDGVMERAEIALEDGSVPYKVGDVIDVYVMEKRSGEIRLSRAVSGAGGMNILREAREKSVPVEGRVLEVVKGGYRVEVVKHRAFCPFSQMDTSRTEDPAFHVGKTYHFVITELDEDDDNIVLSRRAILERERELSQTAFLAELRPGDVIQGTVKRIMPYGAVVEIAEGIEGMVHVSEMSWSRILSPEDILHPAERVTVKVISVEDDPAKGRRRISLSMKQVGEDPWTSVDQRYTSGQRLRARVTRLAEFGAFAEIEPGVEGLVHISEMSYIKRVRRPDELVAVGDEVDVMIKEISSASRRISLSMKEAEGDPWIGAAERYPAGRVVEGVVERRERFGVFVRLEPGITGLLPKSIMERFPEADAIDRLRPGDAVVVTVERVDPEQRRISLSPADACDDTDWRSLTPATDQKRMGTLGDKLKKALEKKTEP